MREHQIIINLKPEHYQELERLSRASGARSVSVFVKERMLASLGIGGSSSSMTVPGTLNVASVTADIRRLHRDLQVFVAESLSGKDFGYTPASVEGEPLTPGAELARAVATGSSSQSLSQSSSQFLSHASSQSSSQSSNYGEQSVPERAGTSTDTVVPIAQLAPLENPPSSVDASGWQSTQTAFIDSPSASVTTTSASLPPPAAPPAAPSAALSTIPSNQAIPRQQLDFPMRPRGTGTAFTGIASGLGALKSADSVMADPATVASVNAAPSDTLRVPGASVTPGAPGAPAAPGVPATPDALAHPKVVTAAAMVPGAGANMPDDLEELAERAFAISPRLGAMEEIDDDVPMFSDPLDELLGEIEDAELRSSELAANRASSVPTAQVHQAKVARTEDAHYEDNETTEPAQESDSSASEITSTKETYDEQPGDERSGNEQPGNELAGNQVQAVSHSSSASLNTSSDSGEVASSPDTHSDYENLDDPAGDESQLKSEGEAASGENSPDDDSTNQSGTTTTMSQNPPPISGGPPPRRRRT